MLTPEQLDEFRRCGILRVPGAVPTRDADAMCDSVWEVLRLRYGIRRDDRESWKGRRVNGHRELPKSLLFEQVASHAVRELLDELLGNWEPPTRWGTLLVAFPESHGPWDVPRQNWHLDAPVVRSLRGLYGVRVFTLLAPLPAGGGGTLAVAGSYRLAEKLADSGGFERLRSTEVRKVLVSRNRWLRDLCSRGKVDRIRDFMNATSAIAEVDVRVVEMTGEPGDVFLMHPLTMHAPSLNCADIPRMVLSTTVYQRGVDPSILYVDPEAAA
jgi:hypothetical protein